jgi:hypothetical protein
VEPLALDGIPRSERTPGHEERKTNWKGRERMTIDERLEALTQSMELLVGIHKDTEKRLQALADAQIEQRKDMLRMQRHFSRFELIILGWGEEYEDRMRKLEDKLWRGDKNKPE